MARSSTVTPCRRDRRGEHAGVAEQQDVLFGARPAQFGSRGPGFALDRVGPAQLPERQHQRLRVTTQQAMQQRGAGPGQAHHDQRPRQRCVEQAWPAAELVA